MLKTIFNKFLRLPHRDDTLYGILFLLFLIAPIIFTPLMNDGFEPIKFFVFLVLSGIAIIVTIRRGTFFANNYALILLGLFWVLNLLSTIFSVDKIYSIVGLGERYPGSMISITAWVILIMLVWTVVRNEENRRLSLIRVVVFQGLAIAVLGITQQFDIAYYGGITEYARPIIPSFLGNQNFSAMYLIGAVAGIGVLWQYAKSRAAIYYYAVTGLIVVFAIVLSGSRGALLGLAVSMFVYLALVLWRKYPKVNLIAILMMIAFSAITYLGFQSALRTDQLSNSVSAADSTVESRYIIWADSINMIAQNPILGAGHGNFFIQFQEFGHTHMVGNHRFDDAHNLFLNLAATVGLPAVLVLLVIIGLSVLLAWRQIKDKQASSLWALAVLAGVLVAASFNPVSISNWLLIALAIAFAYGNETMQYSLRNWQKVLLTVVAFIFIIFPLCFFTSEIFSQKSLQAYRTQQYEKSVEFGNAALTLNPVNSSAQIQLIASNIRQKKDLEKQAELIDKLISQHPKSAGLYKPASNLYGMLYLATKDEKYAQRINQLMTISETLEPDSAELLGTAAFLQYQTGQYDRALVSIDKLLGLPNNEQYSYFWILRGMIFMKNGDKDSAVYSLEKGSRALTGQPALKSFLTDLKKSEDVTKLVVPIYLPDIDF